MSAEPRCPPCMSPGQQPCPCDEAAELAGGARRWIDATCVCGDKITLHENLSAAKRPNYRAACIMRDCGCKRFEEATQLPLEPRP